MYDEKRKDQLQAASLNRVTCGSANGGIGTKIDHRLAPVATVVLAAHLPGAMYHGLKLSVGMRRDERQERWSGRGHKQSRDTFRQCAAWQKQGQLTI